ncbi:MAG: hypothetical protein CENE_03754 [Candidatus Celerinatantimonas neptuna]|nr:MAG: hypothetical protein CENE_03754 [Candidatus Celerinatantimonas neptuna]
MYLSALHAAIYACGGQKRLTDSVNRLSDGAAGLRQNNVCKWVQLGRVPGKWVLMGEQVSGIPCWELRPDLYPPERFKSQDA